MRRRRRTAFTLVELLVVMAIIGILAGMMFPIFGAMRTRAKITKARHQVDQIAFAWKAYQLKVRILPGMQNVDRDMDATAWPDLVPYIETTNLMSTNAAGVPVDPWNSYYKVHFSDLEDDINIKVWSCGPNKLSFGSVTTNGGDDVRSW